MQHTANSKVIFCKVSTTKGAKSSLVPQNYLAIGIFRSYNVMFIFKLIKLFKLVESSAVFILHVKCLKHFIATNKSGRWPNRFGTLISRRGTLRSLRGTLSSLQGTLSSSRGTLTTPRGTPSSRRCTLSDLCTGKINQSII